MTVDATIVVAVPVITAGIGFSVGVLLTMWEWRKAVRNKAETGTPLLVGDDLFAVRPWCSACNGDGWLLDVNRAAPCDCCEEGKRFPDPERVARRSRMEAARKALYE